jgi:hypothetical protein
MSIEWKIRQYMHGFLLLALAGVIIAMIDSVITSIPDTTISVGNGSAKKPLNISVAVFEPVESGLWYGIVYYSYYDLYLPPPPAGYKYVVVFKVELHPQYGFEILRNVEICDDQGWFVFWDTELDECCRYTVDGDDYYFIEWDREIIYTDIYSYYVSYSERVYVYTVPVTMSVPFPLDIYQAQTAQADQDHQVAVSSKTILRFISFVASIEIIIAALQKFDIEF